MNRVHTLVKIYKKIFHTVVLAIFPLKLLIEIFVIISGWGFGSLEGEMSDINIGWCPGNTPMDGTRTSKWNQ